MQSHGIHGSTVSWVPLLSSTLTCNIVSADPQHLLTVSLCPHVALDIGSSIAVRGECAVTVHIKETQVICLAGQAMSAEDSLACLLDVITSRSAKQWLTFVSMLCGQQSLHACL